MKSPVDNYISPLLVSAKRTKKTSVLLLVFYIHIYKRGYISFRPWDPLYPLTELFLSHIVTSQRLSKKKYGGTNPFYAQKNPVVLGLKIFSRSKKIHVKIMWHLFLVSGGKSAKDFILTMLLELSHNIKKNIRQRLERFRTCQQFQTSDICCRDLIFLFFHYNFLHMISFDC